MKNLIIITLILIICSAVIAQELENDIIQINYEKKSPAKAMMLSSLFPGAGQFYANRRSITTYIFPIIEIGLIAGYFINYNDGLDKEADYQDFADPLYNRSHQHSAENDIIPNNMSYYEDHFRLDDDDTQHFYEDIGKYDKYIFGWIDWFDIYARGENGEFTSPSWIWDGEGIDMKIAGVDTLNSDSEYYVTNTYGSEYSWSVNTAIIVPSTHNVHWQSLCTHPPCQCRKAFCIKMRASQFFKRRKDEK